MSEREIIKKYGNGDLTVIWKPKICIHAGECVKRLPNVYDPNVKPWIKAENASIEELKDQINACPSGALTFEIKGKSQKDVEVLKTQIEVKENGPLLVYGVIDVTLSNGSIEEKSKTTAFCRCGASLNKPFCDGSHIKDGFKG